MVTSHRLTVISDTSRLKMAAGDALVALKAYVARADYCKLLRTLEDVQSYLDSCYPSLEQSVIKDDDDSFFVTLIFCQVNYVSHCCQLYPCELLLTFTT